MIFMMPGRAAQRAPTTVPTRMASTVPAMPSMPVTSKNTMAETAPMMNWPSPPRLKTPQRYAKAAASAVKMSGQAETSELANFCVVPREPENSRA